MTYESILERESHTAPEVTFVLAKMSFGRRLELTRRLREIAQRVEFLEAGDVREKIEAALLSAEIERLYVVWGIKEIRGLELDGEPATPESLASIGPEELFREALAFVKSECGLTETERKN
ncbi:MAG TPA: hypothetical protein VL285_09055 [Bryobacteraceae bacterium]|jgi:hypothetical protein|nr:hypothetical protein [Bryobacteraceae bacterium]